MNRSPPEEDKNFKNLHDEPSQRYFGSPAFHAARERRRAHSSVAFDVNFDSNDDVTTTTTAPSRRPTLAEFRSRRKTLNLGKPQQPQSTTYSQFTRQVQEQQPQLKSPLQGNDAKNDEEEKRRKRLQLGARRRTRLPAVVTESEEERKKREQQEEQQRRQELLEEVQAFQPQGDNSSSDNLLAENNFFGHNAKDLFENFLVDDEIELNFTLNKEQLQLSPIPSNCGATPPHVDNNTNAFESVPNATPVRSRRSRGVRRRRTNRNTLLVSDIMESPSAGSVAPSISHSPLSNLLPTAITTNITMNTLPSLSFASINTSVVPTTPAMFGGGRQKRIDGNDSDGDVMMASPFPHPIGSSSLTSSVGSSNIHQNTQNSLFLQGQAINQNSDQFSQEPQPVQQQVVMHVQQQTSNQPQQIVQQQQPINQDVQQQSIHFVQLQPEQQSNPEVPFQQLVQPPQLVQLSQPDVQQQSKPEVSFQQLNSLQQNPIEQQNLQKQTDPSSKLEISSSKQVSVEKCKVSPEEDEDLAFFSNCYLPGTKTVTPLPFETPKEDISGVNKDDEEERERVDILKSKRQLKRNKTIKKIQKNKSEDRLDLTNKLSKKRLLRNQEKPISPFKEIVFYSQKVQQEQQQALEQQIRQQQVSEQQTLQQRFEQQASAFQQQFGFQQQQKQTVAVNNSVTTTNNSSHTFVARKMPDFKAIHAKQFEKMKCVDQVSQEHANRAELFKTSASAIKKSVTSATTTNRTSIYQRASLYPHKSAPKIDFTSTNSTEGNIVATQPKNSLGGTRVHRPTSCTTTASITTATKPTGAMPANTNATSKSSTTSRIASRLPPRSSRPIGFTTPVKNNTTATTTTTVARKTPTLNASSRGSTRTLNSTINSVKNDPPITVITPKSKSQISGASFQLTNTPDFVMGANKTVSRIPSFKGNTPGSARKALKDSTNELATKGPQKKFEFLRSSRNRQASRIGAHRDTDTME